MLLEQFFLPRDVAAIAFGQNIFAQRFDRLASDDLSADRRLNRNFEQLPWDIFLQAFGNLPAAGVGFVGMNDERKRVDNLAV